MRHSFCSITRIYNLVIKFLVLSSFLYSIHANAVWETAKINQENLESHLAFTTNEKGKKFYLLFNDLNSFYLKGIPLFDYDFENEVPADGAKATVYTSAGVIGTYDIKLYRNKAMLMVIESEEQQEAFIKLIKQADTINISYLTNKYTNVVHTFHIEGATEAVSKINTLLKNQTTNNFSDHAKDIIETEDEQQTAELFEKLVCGLRKSARDHAINLLKNGTSLEDAITSYKRLDLTKKLPDSAKIADTINQLLENDIRAIYFLTPSKALEQKNYSESLFISCIATAETINRQNLTMPTNKEEREQTLHDIVFATFHAVATNILAKQQPTKPKAEVDSESKIIAFKVTDCFVDSLKSVSHPAIDEYVDMMIQGETIVDAKNTIMIKYIDDPSALKAFTQMNTNFNACRQSLNL